jgi:hypothetical protein
MKDLLTAMFGTYSGSQMLGYLWFFIIGYIIYGLNETTGRDIESSNTPRKWNWKFFWKDNIKRYVLTLLTTYIIFRFYTNLSNQPLDYFNCFLIGYIGDSASKYLKDRVGFIQSNREELMKQHLNNELNKENQEQINQ